ncbi:MAG: dehypoxanthine futalosine cyclase [Nitrospirae bacterium GWC2_57_13]|jgi:cyclic dehypoxanthinyl futalosine synthase|nr:MAG: dehypoxanthine futalosine cyclase [Nitrospirae bacterium GWC2_57_13]HAS53793.1 dehypoxanthine futalosine cyclase [Nitrospiraceae bacterium]
MKTKSIESKITAGTRITADEALALYRTADLLTLGELASTVRKRLHPERVVTFIVDRNINYTNICRNRCSFCAFYRDADSPEAYVLSRDEIFRKIEETVAQGGTQILMQGGVHPDLGIEYFEDLFSAIKARFFIQIHSLSPSEISFLAEHAKISVTETLQRLRAAGLDSVPGAGAEILVDRVRKQVSPDKIRWRQWADVMETAHGLGMPTTATMMFGTVETDKEIVQHLVRLREIQDKTRGFTAFIPWTYQPGNTKLGGRAATAVEYLRTLALSRIVLDNFRNIQASWVTQGAKIAQVALEFGANDFGSTMLEENVVAAAGITFRMTKQEIVNMIKDAGYTPAQRDTQYTILARY